MPRWFILTTAVVWGLNGVLGIVDGILDGNRLRLWLGVACVPSAACWPFEGRREARARAHRLRAED